MEDYKKESNAALIQELEKEAEWLNAVKGI